MYLLAAFSSVPKQSICLVTSVYTEMVLGQDHLYRGQTLLYNNYILSTTEQDRRSRCALDCLSDSLECLSFLFSKRLRSCKLLNCQLTEKLVTNSTDSEDWEYWRNLAGKYFILFVCMPFWKFCFMEWINSLSFLLFSFFFFCNGYDF
jgi:hypothetical protein